MTNNSLSWDDFMKVGIIKETRVAACKITLHHLPIGTKIDNYGVVYS